MGKIKDLKILELKFKRFKFSYTHIQFECSKVARPEKSQIPWWIKFGELILSIISNLKCIIGN